MGGSANANGVGIEGDSGGYVGIKATSQASYGLEASSNASHGIYATTSDSSGSSAIVGALTATTGGGYGVLGTAESPHGIGVYAKSQYVGIVAKAITRGIVATASQLGVEGMVVGSSGEGVLAVAGESGTYSLYAEGLEGGVCSIDFNANLNCSGTIMGGQSVRTTHRTSSGRRVVAYASESTSQTIEDFGTAQMTGGLAKVQLDPSFAATIDLTRGYYVFLTPLANTRGLYVSEKVASSFTVREVENGHSRLGFDYRVVAHPLDSKSDRLPAAPAFHRVPAPPAPPPPKIPSRRVRRIRPGAACPKDP